jgi:hypothetical protein
MNVQNLNAINVIVNDDKYTVDKESRMNSYDTFVHSLIREHAEHYNDGYSLDAKDLPLHDQKILLSYEVSAVNYEDALSSPTLTAEYIDDYLESIQAKIDKEIGKVYAEDMEEMGVCLHQYKDGSLIWVRR